VGEAGVDFQGAVLQKSGGQNSGIFIGHDLVIVPVHHQYGDLYALQILGEVGLRKRHDPVIVCLCIGGSYSAPAMQGEVRDGSTLAREAYFVEFTRDIRTVARMPVMVNGGVRRRPIAELAAQSGMDMVGIGAALTSDSSVSPLRALVLQQLAMAFRTRQYRRWVEKRSM